ncbi:MAG: hypothetical protein ACRC62_17250 [Microcoleus sp.]
MPIAGYLPIAERSSVKLVETKKYGDSIDSQLSTLNYQLSTLDSQLSTLNSQLYARYFYFQRSVTPLQPPQLQQQSSLRKSGRNSHRLQLSYWIAG